MKPGNVNPDRIDNGLSDAEIATSRVRFVGIDSRRLRTLAVPKAPYAERETATSST
jgi:hypothetical protein